MIEKNINAQFEKKVIMDVMNVEQAKIAEAAY